MKLTLKSAIAAIGVAALLGGCGGGSTAEFDTPTPDTGATTDTGDAGDTGDSTEAEPNAPADVPGARWPDPATVVAEDVFEAFNKPGEMVRVGIESIVVGDTTMELRLIMTPEGNADGVRVWDVLADGASVNVRLMDRTNLKEYRVLRTTGREAYQPDDQVRLVPGQSLGFPIFYAAPEDDITVVDVQLSSGLPIFEDVPLTFED